jgi:ubiquinone/menaquinone biosynthesis C-methylase UbiE
MDGNPISLVRPVENEISDRIPSRSVEQIIDFYEEAGMDYEHWSRALNMHLGFYRWGMNPFNRDGMLEQLNLEVASRLKLNPETPAFLIDLGCGMGAIARSVARNYSNCIIKGVTLSPSQVRIASDQNLREGLENSIEIFKGNYTDLPFEDGLADGVWAVESACYAKGADKADLIDEMARVLRPGGRFVVADCFVKQLGKKFNPLVKRCYSAACKSWALTEMPTREHFVAALKRHGFRDIAVEDISWQVAPSLAHAPFAVATFILKKMLTGERLKAHSINNLKASLLALILGINRSKFSYCIVSGTRD